MSRAADLLWRVQEKDGPSAYTDVAPTPLLEELLYLSSAPALWASTTVLVGLHVQQEYFVPGLEAKPRNHETFEL